MWRALRGRRAHPPVPTGSAVRAATFQAALEQAEQQFRAAANIDFDSRALNLFYGLSQAGRAIAAACPDLPNNGWQLTRHGLRVLDLDHVRNVDDVRVQVTGPSQPSDDGSSFRRLSALLNSEQPRTVALGDVWPLAFDTKFGPNLGGSLHEPLVVYPDPQPIPSGEFEAQAATIELPGFLSATPLTERPTLRDFLGRYPSLSGWVDKYPNGAPQDWSPPNVMFTLRWPRPADFSDAHVLDPVLSRYRGYQIAQPTMPGSIGTIHPLMAWWLILYALSMLTRYQPAAWTRIIDVNTSVHATAIEFVLERAVSAVPDLVDETIDAVAVPATLVDGNSSS